MGKVGWGWRWGRHDFYDDGNGNGEERDLGLETQMEASIGEAERVVWRARERKRGVVWGGGLVSRRGVRDGAGFVREKRRRESVEWGNRVGR